MGCGKKLGFLPDTMCIAPLTESEGGTWTADSRTFKECLNYSQQNVCNWMVPADDPCDFCIACRLNEVIPDLTVPANLERWATIEGAKRRLIYTLLQLELPVTPKSVDPVGGLSFRFLADSLIDPAMVTPVLTGHEDGIITINLAEADDVEREKMRNQLHEPFRTLLGHFRHEIGHYYWDRLVANSKWLAPFREMFGDETADYQQALETHYNAGPSPDWNQSFISTYASSHPWEDWAETWAHYLHMHDTLETAHDVGLGTKSADPKVDLVERMVAEWFDVAVAINSLNRSLGLRDAYPFVLASPVLDKLRFIHQVVGDKVGDEKPAPQKAEPVPAAVAGTK